ncbi:MAG TPA: dihydroorotate dehydrogenase electron transfer subunit [Gammaproteobacteria bacterium]|nr:dihydroorotate dehydrogenase electron transfer subunit [Gammaproteobacteria bacterium]
MAYGPEQRGTLVIEDGVVQRQDAYSGLQHVVRLQAPQIAAHARPGCFVHLQCDPALPMRRPMSLMRVNAFEGWIDILYKRHGLGTERLAGRKPGEYVSMIGPIGVPFKLKEYRAKPLLIGGGVGIPPMLFLAEHMRQQGAPVPLVLMGSEVPFPFTLRPSTILVPGMPGDVIAAMPLLEDWRIPCRLASRQGFAGSFDGTVTELARRWLKALPASERNEVEIFSCGPTSMLKAVKKLSAQYELPCQLSLEEYMACAVGGCAGCTVLVQTDEGPAMKRVCVDGPVFDAKSVIFQ